MVYLTVGLCQQFLTWELDIPNTFLGNHDSLVLLLTEIFEFCPIYFIFNLLMCFGEKQASYDMPWASGEVMSRSMCWFWSLRRNSHVELELPWKGLCPAPWALMLDLLPASLHLICNFPEELKAKMKTLSFLRHIYSKYFLRCMTLEAL